MTRLDVRGSWKLWVGACSGRWGFAHHRTETGGHYFGGTYKLGSKFLPEPDLASSLKVGLPASRTVGISVCSLSFRVSVILLRPPEWTVTVCLLLTGINYQSARGCSCE